MGLGRKTVPAGLAAVRGRAWDVRACAGQTEICKRVRTGIAAMDSFQRANLFCARRGLQETGYSRDDSRAGGGDDVAGDAEFAGHNSESGWRRGRRIRENPL